MPEQPSHWCSFDGWQRPNAVEPRVHDELQSWAALDSWTALAGAAADQEEATVREQVQEWAMRLKDLGGEPSFSDWAGFRPLRLTREEDWSNWLGFLLSQPSGHALVKHLFGPDAPAIADVEYERAFGGHERRVDLLLHWKDGTSSSIEVKVGDESLAKTFDTIELCEREFPRRWKHHWILLPQGSLGSWNAVADERDPQGKVCRVITWDEVAVGLRRLLWSRATLPGVAAWALALCGAAEQQLLGVPRMGTAGSASERLRAASLRRRLLEEGRRE